MKCISLLVFSVFSLAAYSQDGYTELPPEDPKLATVPFTTWRQYGYVDGVRLDSLPADFVVVFGNGKFMYVDYGKSGKKAKNSPLTNVEEAPFLFARSSTGTALNFLNFNGWTFVNAYSSGADSYPSLIFRKKDKN